MKKILFICTAILSFALFVSCEDSLGIDENVQKNPIVENPTDTTIESTIYEITNKDWIFVEEFFIRNNTYIFEWYNDINYQRNSVKIDTSKTYYYLWVDLDVECTSPDNKITNRNDRITGLTLEIDSLKIENIVNKLMYGNDNEFGGIKFKLFVKDLTNEISTVYTQNDLFFMFRLDIDRVRKVIDIHIIFWIAHIENQFGRYDTNSLQTFVTLQYDE